LFPIAATIAFAASFLAMKDLPTVGASAMVYAISGMLVGMTANGRITVKNKKEYALLIASVALSLVTSYIRTNSNFSLNLDALLVGFIFSTACLGKPKSKHRRILTTGENGIQNKPGERL
jgi:membrane associated rhomboid family serine protease